MKKVYIIIFTTIITVTSVYFLYKKYTGINITIKFDELEPFDKQMNIYYKGFKIGRTTKIYPDKDYQNTFIKAKLKSYNINLPENIKAKIKRTSSGKYVDILYPDEPLIKRIANNSTISGCVSKDIGNILNNSIAEDDIEIIVDEATTLMESATNTIQSLGKIFEEINSILLETRNDIKTSTTNLAKCTKNLEEISDSLNAALSKENTKTSAVNIVESTQNIKEITQNLNAITETMNDTTMPVINSILCETNQTIENTAEITTGIKNTLKKRLGLSKLMFGKPIDNNN